MRPRHSHGKLWDAHQWRRIGIQTGLLLWAFAVLGFAHAKLGDIIEDLEMPTLAGSRAHLIGDATANVFVFFKPGQEHSNATLQQIAACEREMSGKSVRWVAIVSDRFSKGEIEAAVKEGGIAMPVLIDVGDAFYGKLGVSLTPVVGIADRQHRLVAYQPFAKVNYSEIIRARIRRVLGEINDQELEQVLRPQEIVQGSDAEIARRRLKLAEKLFEARNYPQALASAKRSLEKDATSAAAHALIGRILAAEGKRAEALQSFEQALKLDPSNTNALAGKKELAPSQAQ